MGQTIVFGWYVWDNLLCLGGVYGTNYCVCVVYMVQTIVFVWFGLDKL